jgi:NAD(P)-dependent dehydrogenase (short-subunit alcohol dehydrogenase family)
MTGRVRFDFDGCRVLVTGGSNGIGLGIARAFSEAGAHVAITGRKASASDYDADLGAFDYHQAEMTDAGAIAALASGLDALDVLVNNAGANFPFDPSEWDPDIFDQAVHVNLNGSFRLSAACKPLLAASDWPGGSSIINLASMAAYRAVTLVPGYGAAKAGIVQMTKNMAVAWVDHGIRINAVAPGLTESNMTAVMKGVAALEDPEMAKIPMARWGTPQDIAGTVLFLASPTCSYVTGQTWNVDGGYSAT